MPDALMIAVVVYGQEYTRLFSEVCLPNLAAIVMELSEATRRKTIVRIVTTAPDHAFLKTTSAFRLLLSRVQVRVSDDANRGNAERDWGYAPMVGSQRLLVIEAARANAAILFVGPDTFYSRGSLRFLLHQVSRGYRLVVGPGFRIKRDAALPFLRSKIAESADRTLAFSPDEQIETFFRFYHPSMDAFVLESSIGVWWKAYVFHRPLRDEMFIRYFQGPTLIAWPRSRKDDFDGFVDHALPDLCCATWREIYVVRDAYDCFQLDLTDDDRDAGLVLSDFPRTDLLKGFFQKEAIRTFKLLYGLRTCRVHRGRSKAGDIAQWERRFDDTIDPLILLALVERRFGPRCAPVLRRIYKVVCILGTNTWRFLLTGVARKVLSKYKHPDPLFAPR